MHFSQAPAKGDISTLPTGGHFYFALTLAFFNCQRKVEMSYSLQSRNVLFWSGLERSRVSLAVPVKRRRAMLASNPIEE
jgi:hypothetical protein